MRTTKATAVGKNQAKMEGDRVISKLRTLRLPNLKSLQAKDGPNKSSY